MLRENRALGGRLTSELAGGAASVEGQLIQEGGSRPGAACASAGEPEEPQPGARIFPAAATAGSFVMQTRQLVSEASLCKHLYFLKENIILLPWCISSLTAV